MMIQRLKREIPDAQNVTKVRITAHSKDDIEKAAKALVVGWTHFQIKKIPQLNQKDPDMVAYCIMLWN